MSMGMPATSDNGCVGMSDTTAAQDTVDKPMKKGAMDKEHSMAIPAPSTDKPKDPPGPMTDH
jgi:hypothetical protein